MQLLFISYVLFFVCSCIHISNSSFISSTAPLSQPRAYSSATSVGRYALFGGGVIPQYFSKVVDVFDATTQLWSTTSLSQARWELASTSVGGYAFFAGGSGPDSNNNTVVYSHVDIFNTSLHLSTATLSQARRSLAATSVGQYALFGGGFISTSFDLTFFDVVDIFNSSVQQWSTTTLSQARSNLAATSVGRYALFAGGLYGRGNTSRVVDIFDSVTQQWSTATLSYARYNIAATSAGRYALFAGGVGYSIAESSVVDIFDSETLQWSTATLSTYGRYAGATVSQRYALFGGGNFVANGAIATIVDIFDSVTLQWSQIESSYGNPSATSVAQFVLFAFENTVDIYRYEEDTQSPNSAPLSAPTSQSSIIVLEEILNGVIQPDTAANIQPDGLIELTLEPDMVAKLNSGTSCELNSKKRQLVVELLVISVVIVYLVIPVGRAIIYRIRKSFLPEQITTTQNERYGILEIPFKISCSTAKRSTNIVENPEDNAISYMLYHNSSNIIFGVGLGNQLLGYYAIEVEGNSFIGNVSISFGYNATSVRAPISSDPTHPLSTPQFSGAYSVMINSLFAHLFIAVLTIKSLRM